jgi:N-carbamoylputrescine amidase
MRDVKVALAVMNCKPGEPDYNFSRTVGFVREASRLGAELVCFPEASLTGYGFRREDSGMALPLDHPLVRALESLSREHNMVLLVGLMERASHGLYLTHLVIGPGGERALYRKVNLGPPERGIFLSGNTVDVFCLQGITFGLGLCYDAHFPEHSTAIALQGADLILFPHASPGGSPQEKLARWMRYLPARAVDNGTFVLACNQTGEGLGHLRFPGVAVLLNPRGRVMESYAGMEEKLLIAELRASELEDLRAHPMAYFLPFRRPEIYMKILSKVKGVGEGSRG